MPNLEVRPTGIDPVRAAPWGSHFCHFYETAEDLVDLLVPYFKAGLENNEFCMWITSEPLSVAEATKALQAAVPDLGDRMQRGQIEIIDYSQWYTASGRFDAEEVLQGWMEKDGRPGSAASTDCG